MGLPRHSVPRVTRVASFPGGIRTAAKLNPRNQIYYTQIIHKKSNNKPLAPPPVTATRTRSAHRTCTRRESAACPGERALRSRRSVLTTPSLCPRGAEPHVAWWCARARAPSAAALGLSRGARGHPQPRAVSRLLIRPPAVAPAPRMQQPVEVHGRMPGYGGRSTSSSATVFRSRSTSPNHAVSFGGTRARTYRRLSCRTVHITDAHCPQGAAPRAHRTHLRQTP